MSRVRPIAIILPNLLQRLGVQEIFQRYFSSSEIEVFEKVPESMSAEDYCCFVTDAATYISASDFFLPRRSRCAVLVGSPHVISHSDSPVIISLDSSLEDMIDALGHFLGSIRKLSKPGAVAVHSEELSPREIQVLQLAVSGVINKDIASQLNISMNTVLTHRKNITAKLGIKTISGLTLYALMNGYISPEQGG